MVFLEKTELDNFFDTARADLDDRLRDIIEKYDDSDKLRYFLTNGKRLRPLLCLLTFGACNGGDYAKALDLAVAIELHHSASLIHDDIIDGDNTRRNKLSYHETFGVEDAILTGHRAIVLGFKYVLDHDPMIVRTLFDTWDQSLKGEIADIDSRKNIIALIETADRMYFEVILGKTASLYAGACKVGSQEANAPASLQNMFYEYGKSIGIAYQLADDMHDVGNRLEMLPLAWIMNHFSVETKNSLLELMDNKGMLPRQALTAFGIETDSFFIKEIENSVSTAESIIKHGWIPNFRFKQMLLQTPRYIISKCMEN